MVPFVVVEDVVVVVLTVAVDDVEAQLDTVLYK